MTTGMQKRLHSGGCHSLYQAGIVDYLEQEKIPATFFVTGLWAEEYPEAVRHIAGIPFFEIGNHSYSHCAFSADCFGLPELPDRDKQADLQKSQTILTKLTGKKPFQFRFPGGCNSPKDVALVKSQGLRIIGWSFASGDAFNRNTQSIVDQVLSKAKNGSIVVFHLLGDRYGPKSEEALRLILPELKKKGFRFVKVSDLAPTKPI